MSWDRVFDYQGIKVTVHSDVFSSGKVGESVGFFFRDPNTIEAIRNRDKRILDFLNLMVNDIEEFSHAQWATHEGWLEDWGEGKSINQLKEKAEQILYSTYAPNSAKRNAQKVLDSFDCPRTTSTKRKK